MDKTIILAVAGSGKTTFIIDQLDLKKRSLIVTYTNNNIKNLREGIIKKFSYFPDNILLLPYFTFIYSYCFRPFLSYELKTRGINFNPNKNKYAKKDHKNYYIDKNNKIYSNRISKLLEFKKAIDDIKLRLEKYFDNIFIDEIQDLAGNDFNFLKSISAANLDMTFVGDFYQHTFDTSRDRKVNNNLHNNYENYKSIFSKIGINVDTNSLEKSYRCSPTVCNFITEKIGINILSNRNDKTELYIINSVENSKNIFHNNEIVKLFYQDHYKYNCYSKNWGDCKGENKYNSVCVVLNNKTFKHFQDNTLNELPPQTKNKLYVACSRSRKDLYLVPEKLLKNYKI